MNFPTTTPRLPAATAPGTVTRSVEAEGLGIADVAEEQRHADDVAD